MKFAECLVNKSKIYTYAVPDALEEQVQIGSAVRVPLRAKFTTAYVVGLVQRPEFPTKDIVSVEQKQVFDKTLAEVARWISEHYRCYLSVAFKAILPRQK